MWLWDNEGAAKILQHLRLSKKNAPQSEYKKSMLISKEYYNNYL